MTYRNIMVPFDGSESAMNALTEAKSLAQIDTSSMLHVVNVAPIPESQMLMMVDPNALEVQPAYYSLEEFKALREKALEEKREELRKTIAPYVDTFISFAKQHPEKFFYVTRIGCGIAGFHDRDIAPLFASAAGFSVGGSKPR